MYMPYQSAYRPAYRPRRHRRRNSHYGVLIALILVIIIAVPVAFHIVKGISSAIFGGDQNQLVYQIDNTRACADGKAVDLEAAPYRNSGGTVYVPVDSLCTNLGLKLSWDSAGMEKMPSCSTDWQLEVSLLRATATSAESEGGALEI